MVAGKFNRAGKILAENIKILAENIKYNDKLHITECTFENYLLLSMLLVKMLQIFHKFSFFKFMISKINIQCQLQLFILIFQSCWYSTCGSAIL